MKVGTKTRSLLILGTKSDENKIYGPKWESPENIDTKMWFSPRF